MMWLIDAVLPLGLVVALWLLLERVGRFRRNVLAAARGYCARLEAIEARSRGGRL